MIQVVSYLMESSKNVLSEWIPFDFIPTNLNPLHLNENFAFGIRPSDDGAIIIFATSSQLGPVHLHMELMIK